MPDVHQADDTKQHNAIRDDVAQLFRAEALEEYQRGRTDEGHLLDLDPRWMRRAYGVVLALIVVALVIGALVLGGRFG